jgi:hypothetical protein
MFTYQPYPHGRLTTQGFPWVSTTLQGIQHDMFGGILLDRSSLHKVDLRTVGSRVGWRLQSVKHNASVLQAAGVLKHAA